MGLSADNNLGGICGYAKSKYEERVEHKRKRRSHSEEPAGDSPRKDTGKLYKPPQVRTVSEKPRNRLRKHITQTSIPYVHALMKDLFVLEYEPYPNSSEPGQVLGIYATFNSVTSGAFEHGAYTFSREGLLDGNEYLSPTGRIKLVRTTVQRVGMRAPIIDRNDSLQGEHVRLDIPHPESQKNDASSMMQADSKPTVKDAVFLAIRVGPRIASWIGVFADKGLAWGACLKDKAMCAASGTLCDEVREIVDNNMPQITGRLVGSGRFTWKVEEHTIDESRRPLQTAVCDV